jgi:hypothetical protein
MKKSTLVLVLFFVALAFACLPVQQSKAAPSADTLDPQIYLPLVVAPFKPSSSALVIDHTTADITKIPTTYINKAISNLNLYYGHTSHGSQIVTGMGLWMINNPLYSFVSDGSIQSGYLSLDDDYGPDLGASPWADLTDTYLQGTGKNRNLIMWSWCGQLAGYSDSQVQDYLNEMSALEKKYPNVRFVYMTQHTNSGVDPEQNDMIRAYANANGKLLFDFADMEKYRPDGTAVPMSSVSDGCPWCQSYCNQHPAYCSDLSKMDDCAHSHKLLCKIKGQAFWWMLARLAGWDGTPVG